MDERDDQEINNKIDVEATYDLDRSFFYKYVLYALLPIVPFVLMIIFTSISKINILDFT